MSQHAKDRFGSDASREQDAVPIDRLAHHGAGEDEPQQPETLAELEAFGGLRDAERNAGDATDIHAQELAENASNALSSGETTAGSNAEMSAQVRRAAHAARVREMRRQSEHERVPMNPGEALHSLEEQGFSEDEALGLLAITGRLDESAEAREAEATLQRLRFTRWLVEQGKLDEWTT